MFYIKWLIIFLALNVNLNSATSQSLEAEIDTIFSAYDSSDRPAVSVLVNQYGEAIFKRAYGMANLKNGIIAESDTAFHLASVGKQMTALAILMLDDQGKLSIDDYVSKYIPEFNGWGGKVKIRHLLHHTSGLLDYYDNIEDSYRKPNNAQALKYLAQKRTLKFTPGSRFDYSNSGYDTLGTIIQRVSKRKFSQFMQERIFAPAGMSNTFAFDSNRRAISKRAIGYYPDRGEFIIDDTSPLNRLHGSGSIYSSADDMSKYDKALFGYHYLNKETTDLMFISGRLNNKKSIDYGYGWDILFDEQLGLQYYGHSGAWMGFASYYLHYPDISLSIIIMSNDANADTEEYAFETAKAVTSSNEVKF